MLAPYPALVVIRLLGIILNVGKPNRPLSCWSRRLPRRGPGVATLAGLALAAALGASSLALAAPPIAGTLDAIGSDTLAGLMMRWGEQFAAHHPGVRLQLQASGSATAPPALAEGATRLGAMSRRMSDAERAAFIAGQGYPPTAVPVALDALTVFVNRDNPIAALSRDQLDAIFSDTRRCSTRPPVTRWGQLGLTGQWSERPITRHSRNSVSGTFEVFQREVLCHGAFQPSVNQYPGSAAVVAAVGDSPGGIGYAGMGYLTAAVKPLALIDAQGRRVQPSAKTAVSGAYPLTRTLFIYLNKRPGEPLPALERAFLALVLSPAGQARVAEAGFIPLPESTRLQWRKRLGLAAGADE